ncbi:MAG: hypothetical protein LBR07_02730 [Puniceicoccales bacterium]|jgi:ATP-dependent protease ClpP protease subunit|nr:hypothetical protein [Puniceicoccales bacterium]
MPNWTNILNEISQAQLEKNFQQAQSPLDQIRRKYLSEFAKFRGRNVIAYYSGWLQRSSAEVGTSINDDDKNAFMSVINGMDRKRGLDLLLHTPGGGMSATESLIDYLHKMFNGDIEAFIPQIAMSAGTMIACSCRQIYMGKQSSIGPIDPQFGGIPAYGVIKEFDDALAAIKKDPASIPLWQTIIGKYHPTFIGECRNAIMIANEIVEKYLGEVMFSGEKNAKKKIDRIINSLNEHNLENKAHDRHISVEKAEEIGLKIERFENDQKLQDAVLSVHHCYMHTFANSLAIKIVENGAGIAVISSARAKG